MDVRPARTADSDSREELLFSRQFTHDIRSPVAAIAALSNALCEALGGAVSERQLRKLRLIHAASVSLDCLVADAHELVRSGAPHERPELENFSLREVLSGLRDALRPATELTGAVIDLRVEGESRRRGPETYLRRVLFNLASIPLRSGYDGVVEIRSEALDGHAVRFTIRSDVVDLEPAEIETVRDVAFGRRPRDRSCFSTFGLELAFRLVDSMGSVLEAAVDRQAGTAFSFVLDLPVSHTLPRAEG